MRDRSRCVARCPQQDAWLKNVLGYGSMIVYGFDNKRKIHQRTSFSRISNNPWLVESEEWQKNNIIMVFHVVFEPQLAPRSSLCQ